MTDSLHLATISTEEEWDALTEQWNPLVERSASSTIFLTWEWLRPWWRHYSSLMAPRALHVLVAREGSRIIGIAPLYRTRVSARGLGSLERIGFIGDCSGDSEYLDFIIERGREADVLAAFIHHLHQHRWDLLDCQRMPQTSPNFPLLQQLAAERGYIVSSDELPCSYITLPTTWELYLKSIKRKFASHIRALLRRLPVEHDGRFSECTDAASLRDELVAMFNLHEKRWRAAAYPGTFTAADRRRFYQDMAEAFLQRGWLRFYSLRLGREPVAYIFCFEHQRRVYALQHAFDIEYGNRSFGNLVFAHAIKEAIDRGATEMDFLRGHTWYKGRWGAVTKYCVRLTLARRGLRTRWYLWLPRFLKDARDRARSMTPDSLLNLKRHLQDRLRRARFS
jgi:CelD/BcsL family acetyltransferase involved in cellulose biosynthesis